MGDQARLDAKLEANPRRWPPRLLLHSRQRQRQRGAAKCGVANSSDAPVEPAHLRAVYDAVGVAGLTLQRLHHEPEACPLVLRGDPPPAEPVKLDE